MGEISRTICPLRSNQKKTVKCNTDCSWYVNERNINSNCAIHLLPLTLLDLKSNK